MNYKNSLLMLLIGITLLQCAPQPKPNTYPSSTVHGQKMVRGVTYDSFTKLTSDLDSLPAVLKKSWILWKSESWQKLNDYYDKHDYNSEYPPAQGFISVDTIILADDTKIDRYGKLWGKFVAPTGTPFGERALPASSKSRVYYRLEVVKDLPGVLKGPAIPWFEQPGKGTQYFLPRSISALVKEGYIMVIDSVLPKSGHDKYNDWPR